MALGLLIDSKRLETILGVGADDVPGDDVVRK